VADDADPGDDPIIAAIADAFDTGPVPDDLSRFAINALTWRVVDDELAALTFDSATDELIGIRGTSTQRRSVTFDGRGVVVSVTISDASLVGSIEPPATYRCIVEGPRASAHVTTDDDGQLVMADCALPLRLVVETTAGRLVSPWITG
jgi:hypothetical protein